MGMLSRFLSFEKPLGSTLVQLLYYFGLIGLVLHAVQRMWFWLTFLDNDWDRALWMLIKTPFMLVLGIIVLRVGAELALAVLRMDKSLHDQVTGRAVPPKTD